MKNAQYWIINSLENAEQKITDFEDTAIETIQNVKQRNLKKVDQ